MIVLDTDVLSAIMRSRPDPAIARWLDEQPGESIWTTAITVLERFATKRVAETASRR